MAFAATTELHQEHKKKIAEVMREVGKVVVGQEYLVNRLLAGLFTNGHILLEGVPGLAKTLTISLLWLRSFTWIFSASSLHPICYQLI